MRINTEVGNKGNYESKEYLLSVLWKNKRDSKIEQHLALHFKHYCESPSMQLK